MKKRLSFFIFLVAALAGLLAGCQNKAIPVSSPSTLSSSSSSSAASENEKDFSDYDYDYGEEEKALTNLTDRLHNPEAENPLILPQKLSDISQSGITVNDITPNALSGQQAQYAIKNSQYLLLAQCQEEGELHLALYDLAGNLLYEYFPPAGRRIQDVALTDRYAYVLETDNTINTLGDNWAVLCLELSSLTLNRVADAKEPPKNFTPHITAYGNDLLFFGVDSDNNLLLYRYVSQNGEIQELLRFHTFINVWDRPTVCGDSLVFYDYDENGWYVLTYHLEENTVDKYYPTFEYSTEYINAAFAQGDYIAYRTSLNLLYVMNIKTGQIDLVSDESSSFTLKDNKLVYISPTYGILIYDIENKNNYLAKNTQETGFTYGYFVLENGRILVPGFHSETREGIVLEIVV